MSIMRKQCIGDRGLTRRVAVGAGAAFLLTLALLHAGVDYDAQAGRLWVTGFLEETPATAETLLAADRSAGWGVVLHDARTDTVTIDASLWIGCDTDAGTFLQLGRVDHPTETLVVRGNVWVRNPRPSERRTADKRFAIVNRLTLGDPADPSIRPTLKIACVKAQEFGLFVGGVSSGNHFGGDLMVYNSTITAATPDRDHALRGFAYRHSKDGHQGGWYGHEIRLVKSRVSWFGGDLRLFTSMIGYCPPGFSTLRLDTVTFEHCGRVVPLQPYLVADSDVPPCVIRNCTFRDTAGVVMGRPTCLIGCRFQDNSVNVVLEPAHLDVVLIDCDMGAQRDPIAVPRTTAKPQLAAGLNPGIDELQTLEVEVRDRGGRPVPGAIVALKCEDPSAVHRDLAVTGADGRTPSETDNGALVLTARRLAPTEDPLAPEQKRFRYALEVEVAGREPVPVPLPSGQDPVPRTWQVILE